jgi:hypothetical protein
MRAGVPSLQSTIRRRSARGRCIPEGTPDLGSLRQLGLGKARLAILPLSRDANDGPDLQLDLAYVEMLVGESDAAAKRHAYLLTIPSDISAPLRRVGPMWDSLRGNPRFQRLFAAARRCSKLAPNAASLE